MQEMIREGMRGPQVGDTSGDRRAPTRGRGPVDKSSLYNAGKYALHHERGVVDGATVEVVELDIFF